MKWIDKKFSMGKSVDKKFAMSETKIHSLGNMRKFKMTEDTMRTNLGRMIPKFGLGRTKVPKMPKTPKSPKIRPSNVSETRFE